VFLDRDFNNFGDESLGEVTDFRVNSHGSSQRTTVTNYYNLVFVSLNLSRAADRYQHLQRALHARLKIIVPIRR